MEVIMETAIGSAIGIGVVAALLFGCYLVWDLVQDERANREFRELQRRAREQTRKYKGEK